MFIICRHAPKRSANVGFLGSGLLNSVRGQVGQLTDFAVHAVEVGMISINNAVSTAKRLWGLCIKRLKFACQFVGLCFHMLLRFRDTLGY